MPIDSQRYPRVRQLLHLGRGIWVEIDICRDFSVEPRTGSQIEGSGHLQRVHNMQIMRPRLGEVLPRVGRGVTADVSLLPILRRPDGVMLLERLLVVLAVVSKYLSA